MPEITPEMLKARLQEFKIYPPIDDLDNTYRGVARFDVFNAPSHHPLHSGYRLLLTPTEAHAHTDEVFIDRACQEYATHLNDVAAYINSFN